MGLMHIHCTTPRCKAANCTRVPSSAITYMAWLRATVAELQPQSLRDVKRGSEEALCCSPAFCTGQAQFCSTWCMVPGSGPAVQTWMGLERGQWLSKVQKS